MLTADATVILRLAERVTRVAVDTELHLITIQVIKHISEADKEKVCKALKGDKLMMLMYDILNVLTDVIWKAQVQLRESRHVAEWKKSHQ